MEAVLSDSNRKLVLWFEIAKTLIACSLRKKIVPFTIIFGRLSFPVL